MMNVGFIGLGIMGKPMAKNLLKAGYSLYVYDIVTAAAEELRQAGATAVKNCREVAQNCDIIFTMVQNSPQVEAVLKGKDGVLEAIRKDAVLVDLSSIDPNASIAFEKEIAKKGAHMIDAPVSGGEPKAIDGTLSIMCGGDASVFERVKPLLAKMGSSVVLVGAIGSGNMTKLANQIIVAANIAALSEALTLATKAGVKPENVFEAIKGGLAGSTVMNAKTPMILDRNFNPGFRIELHIKDLNNAVSAAKACGMEIPITAQVLGMMNELKEKGKEKCDHSALVQYYESRAAVEVKRS